MANIGVKNGVMVKVMTMDKKHIYKGIFFAVEDDVFIVEEGLNVIKLKSPIHTLKLVEEGDNE